MRLDTTQRLYDPNQLAHFATTGGTVTLGDNISFVSLSFEASGYSVEPGAGPFTLTTGAGGGTISANAGVSVKIDAQLEGTNGINFVGGGTIVLNNAGNGYSGGTTITGGTTVTITTDTDLGVPTGEVTLDSGTLATTATVTLSNNRPIMLNPGGGTFAPASGTTLEIDGVISGAGELTAAAVGGSGTVVLTNASNSYSGGTDIGSGTTLSISSDGNLGDPAGGLTFDGGTLQVTGSITDSRTITLNSGGRHRVGVHGNTVELDGTIGGAGQLTVTGGGNVILTGGNGYTGGTDIGSGTTLTINSDGNLGDPSGGLTFDGGTLAVTTSVVSARAITVNIAGGTFAPTTGNILTLSGVISGAGKLTIASGTVIFGNTANTYQNGTDIGSGATLSIGADGSLGQASGGVTFDGGTLQAFANMTTARSITVNSSGGTLSPEATFTLDVTGVVSGAGELSVGGGGTVVLSNTGNSYQGGTNIGSSTTLSISSDSNLGQAGTAVTFDGGTLVTTANVTSARPITLDTPADAVSPAASTTLTLSGAIGGNGGLTMEGAGTLALGATDSYTGATTISSGTLQTNVANAIPKTSAVLINTGATLALNGHSQNVGSIAGGGGGAGTITLGSATLTTGNDNTNTTFAGTISGAGGGLTKTGTGTLTLSGANTYTGATTVNGGTLIIDTTTNPTVLSPSSALVMGGGTFQLNGVAGDTTQVLNGLTVDKGSSEIIVNNSGTVTTLDLRGTSGLMGLTHNAGGFVDFESSLGTFGVNARVLTNQANDATGILGAWATVNGGSALATKNSSDQIVAYTGYTDINALGPNKVPNAPNANVRINFLGTSGPVPIAAPATNINTLTQNFTTASTIDTSPGILRLGATGGVFITPGNAALTIGTAPNSGTLTAGGAASNQAGSLGFENDSASLLTVNSVIANNGSGVVSVTIGGTGTTVFAGTNTYGGPTTISGGTLQLNAPNSIPSTSPVIVDLAGTLNLNNNSQTVASIADGPNGGGTINLGTTATTMLTTGGNNANTSFSGLVEGAGGLVKVGTGSLLLSNPANSYAGGTTLVSGTLIANGNPADGSGTPLGTGTLTIKGGTLATTLLTSAGSGKNLTNPIYLLGTINIAPYSDPSNPGAQNITLTGQINLNGATRTITGITDQGQVHFGTGGIGTAGETAGLTLTTSFKGSGNYVAFIMDPGNTNQYTGLTTITNGAFLVFEGNTAGGSIHGNVDIEGNGVVDYLGGAAQQLQPTTVVTDNSTGNFASGIYFGGLDLFTSTGDTIAALNGRGTVTLGAAILTIGAGNFSGEIGDGDHSGFIGGGITKNTTGTLILSGQNVYTGLTTVAAGTLEAGAAGTIPSTSAVTVNAGATFDLNSFTQFVGSIAGGGTVSLGSASLVTGFNNNDTTFSGVLQDGGISKGKGGSLIKVGTGTLTLTGANTYTGETFVSAGTLLAAAANTIPSNSALLVDTKGTFDINNLPTTVGSISNGPNGGGKIYLGGVTLTAGGDGSTTAFSGVIQDGGNAGGTGGSFVKTGKGTLFLSGANTYTGTTTVNGGTLDLAGSLTSPVTVNSGATFQMESAGLVVPTNTATTPVTLTTNATFQNFGNLTASSAAVGTAITGTGSTVNNGEGGVISAVSPVILVAQPVGATAIVNFGSVVGTGGTAINAQNSSDLTYGNFGNVTGMVILSPTKNTILLATGLPVNSLAGRAGANNTLRLTGGSTGRVNLNDFTNYQALQKVGGGVWTVQGTGNFVQGTNVEAGTFNLLGNLVSNVTVQGAGTFMGTGTVSGNLINGGIVSPGLANGVVNPTTVPGTLTLKGSYTQNSGGTLVIQVNGTQAGQYSVLSVTGGAQLGGTLDIQSQGKAPRFKPGQKIEILTADGGISGRFATIINNSASDTLITDKVVYESNAVALEATQGSFASIRNRADLTPNQNSVAIMLDTASSDKRNAKLISYLDGRSIPDLPSDFDKIAPEEIASVFRIGTSLADVQTRNIQRRTSDLREGTSGFSAAGFQASGSGPSYSGGLAGPNGSGNGPDGKPAAEAPPDRRWGTFLTGAGDFVHVGSTSNAAGYNLNTGGFTLGADYKLTPKLAVGLSVGYAGTDSRLDNNGRIQVNGGKVGVYGTYFDGGFYGDVMASGGLSNYDVRRGALQGDAKGSTQGSEIDAAIGAGYDWRLDALTIGPTATFQYTYMGIDGFTETGSLAPLRYGSQHGQSARSTIGFKASYDWKSRQRPHPAGVSIRSASGSMSSPIGLSQSTPAWLPARAASFPSPIRRSPAIVF